MLQYYLILMWQVTITTIPTSAVLNPSCPLKLHQTRWQLLRAVHIHQAIPANVGHPEGVQLLAPGRYVPSLPTQILHLGSRSNLLQQHLVLSGDHHLIQLLLVLHQCHAMAVQQAAQVTVLERCWIFQEEFVDAVC